MDVQELLSRFAVALGIGLLIGLERGWRTRDVAAGSRTAGVRTFALSGLLGGLVAALAGAAGGAASAAGGILLGFGFAVFSAIFGLFCREENRAANSFSATTAVAGMVTFALGAYALLGDMRAAAAGAVATAALLALRQDIHAWIEQLTWPELRSVLVLLAMTFVALPIVPETPIGPLGGANLREVWLIAIVLAGVSFFGYAAVKYFGARRGILVASAAGGLVSSTAVTTTNARRAAAGEATPRLLAAGAALAGAISFLRVIAIIAFLQPALLALIGPALAAACAVAAGYAVATVYWRERDGASGEAVEFRNPFGFWNVLGFAALLALIIMVGRYLGENVGAVGTVVGAAAMGLANVDAVTVSIGRLVPTPLAAWDASYAILAAVVTNSFSKLAIGAAIGRGRFALELAAVTLGAMVAGGLVLSLTLMLRSPGG
jgi:uncharacterized membrane protein (DUF4010 family)